MILSGKRLTTRTLTKISLLATMAFIIMLLDFPLGIFPTWLKFDFSDIPALIGALAMGPVVGVVIELIKNLLKIAYKGTETGGIGELANFIIGSSYVFAVGFVYYRNKTIKNAIYGMVLGTLLMAVMGALANYYVLLPLYDKFVPEWGLLAQRGSIVKIAIIPFNILKGITVSLLTFPLYKRISHFLKG